MSRMLLALQESENRKKTELKKKTEILNEVEMYKNIIYEQQVDLGFEILAQ